MIGTSCSIDLVLAVDRPMGTGNMSHAPLKNQKVRNTHDGDGSDLSHGPTSRQQYRYSLFFFF